MTSVTAQVGHEVERGVESDAAARPVSAAPGLELAIAKTHFMIL